LDPPVHLVGPYVEVLCKPSFTAYDFGCPPEDLAMDTVARHEGTPVCPKEKSAVSAHVAISQRIGVGCLADRMI
jgi:hypothetical protein